MSQTELSIEDEKISLKERYKRIKENKPKLRARNIAEELGVSEAELLDLEDDAKVTRLIDYPDMILSEVVNLGEVMALTRNEFCVNERHGVYKNAQFFEHGSMKQGLFVNPDIDLRLFMNHWKFCFAVNEETKSGVRKSLQFFDKSGTAIHKIYLIANSKEVEFEKLVQKLKSDEKNNELKIEEYEQKPENNLDSEIDWQGFINAWNALKDTHDFFSMLKKFKVGREQALRGVTDDLAYKVDNLAPRKVLEKARDKECEIMVFVGNRGCIQIHTGKVEKLVEHGDWYNVLDPMFNLHLREDKIATTWVTKKPTEDGVVTALEVFDSEGELIVTFFGKRKPGIPELDLWREIIAEIPKEESIHVA